MKLSYQQKWQIVQASPVVVCGTIVAVYAIGAAAPALKWLLSREYRASGQAAAALSRQVDLAVGACLTVFYYRCVWPCAPPCGAVAVTCAAAVCALQLFRAPA